MKTKQKLDAGLSNLPAHEHSGGSFAAGFVMGILTGAAGLWMSQNDRGRDLLRQLKQELLDTLEAEMQAGMSSDKKTPSASTSTTANSEKKFPKFAVKRIRRS